MAERPRGAADQTAKSAPSDTVSANGAPRAKSPANGAPRDKSPTNGAPRDKSPTSGAPRDKSPTSGAPRDKSPARGAPLDTDPARWRAFQGRVVRDITAKGLRRTRLLRLRHHLDTKMGKPFDAERFAHDVRRVRNLELFRKIRVAVTPDKDGLVICFAAKDKWSLLPYFNTFFNLGSVSVVAGMHDVNTLGFLSYVDVQLLLYSYLPLTKDSIRPGGLLGFNLPRLFGLPIGYDLELRAITTLRTVFMYRDVVGGYLQMERYGGYQGLRYEPWPWLTVALRQNLYWDRFALAPESPPPTVPTPKTGLTHGLSASMTLGYLSYRDYLMHGVRLYMAVEGASSLWGSDFSFTRVTGEAKGFLRFGPRGGNLGVWLQGGYMKGGGYGNLYFIGSWTGLRGFYTQQLGARSYVLGTLEYRTGLLPMEFPVAWIVPYFRGKALRIQGATFVDMGSVAGAGPWRPRESGQFLMSVGAGLRFIVVRVYKAVLRLDFAYVVSPYRSYDFIVASQQYF